MRHQKSGKKLGRTSAHRKALFRNMVTSLLKHERIVTTAVKAKEVGRLAERMITLGKRGTLHTRRQAISFIKSDEVVKRVFTVYAERYRQRDGGYTRMIKLEPRAGDNAPMAVLELVDRPIKAKDSDKKKAKSEAKKPKAEPKKAKAEPKKAKTEDKKTRQKSFRRQETCCNGEQKESRCTQARCTQTRCTQEGEGIASGAVWL